MPAKSSHVSPDEERNMHIWQSRHTGRGRPRDGDTHLPLDGFDGFDGLDFSLFYFQITLKLPGCTGARIYLTWINDWTELNKETPVTDSFCVCRKKSVGYCWGKKPKTLYTRSKRWRQSVFMKIDVLFYFMFLRFLCSVLSWTCLNVDKRT